MDSRTNKNIFRSLLFGINHGILGAICFYLIVAGKFEFEERAIYAMSAVLFWMGTKRIIDKKLPAV